MSDVPKISKWLLPPVWMVLGILIEWLLHRVLPIHRWLEPPATSTGGLVIAAGIGLALWGVGLFRRAKTGVVPFSQSTALVVSGPYRWTRNPMYVGMALVLLGTAVLLGTVSPLVVPPAFVAVITALFIRHEERRLLEQFGGGYQDYVRRVRRWV